MLTQDSRIINAALSMAGEANATQHALRHVRPGTVNVIVNRSMSITKDLPFSLREHLALRDLSDFISMSQVNKSSVLHPRNTDLLPLGHPRSTRSHALSMDSIYDHRSRWSASDCGISSDEARALVAAAFSAMPNTMEHSYLITRLKALPAGEVPPSVLLAAIFSGKNSRAGRSARARAQRRDRKGRFAWMGGGMTAFVKRSDGSRKRLSGRVVGQGVGDDDTFDIEGPDGQIRRVEAKASEGTKAFLKSADSSPEGFSPTPAESNAGDYFMNESDIRIVEAPNGFYRDAEYSDVGTRYTDDTYEVIKIDAGDSSGDAYEMMPDYLMRRDAQGRRLYEPDKPVYVVRRNGDESTDNGYQTWADVQDWINKDQVNLDKAEGREPDVLARLSPEQYDDLVENVGEGDPVEFARGLLGLEKGTGTGTDTEEEGPKFEYSLPENAYPIDLYEPFVPRTNVDAVSSEYTEDPAELASIFDEEEVRDALEAAILSEDGNPSNGLSPLEFPDGEVDSVPAEALFAALQMHNPDAERLVADIYDSQMDGTPNRDAIDAWNSKYGDAGDEVKARLDDKEEGDKTGEDKETGEGTTTPRPLPALLEGLSDAEKAQFQKDGKYEQYLPRNSEWTSAPVGYYIPDSAPFDRVNNVRGFDPLVISNEQNQSDLVEALQTAIANDGPLPGGAMLYLEDEDGELVERFVPTEAIRDALQLQGVDTNSLIDTIYNDSRDDSSGGGEAALDRPLTVTPEHREWLLDADNRVIENMHAKDLAALRQVITGMDEDLYDRTPGWASRMFQGDLIDLIDENIQNRLDNPYAMVDQFWMSEEDSRLADEIWGVPPGGGGGGPPPPPPPNGGAGDVVDSDDEGGGIDRRPDEGAPISRRRRKNDRKRAQARPLQPGDEELENTPVIPLMSQWRNAAQKKARRYAGLSNIVLKKFAAGWSARGRNRVRPTHEIVPRVADPNLNGIDTRGLDLDTNYRDTNGNIIRKGDIVAHRRGGELQNPDVENVNYLVGEVVERHPYMRVNERGVQVWRAGGLEVKILQSDNPDYVGKTFEYIARFSEIVEQPDLKQDALANESADAKYKRSLWDMNDAQLFTEYGDMLRVVQQQGRQPNEAILKMLGAVSNELTTRNTFDPKHMSWLLTDLTDEALSSLGRDIGPDEGASGEVLRRLIDFEWERRQNNQNDRTFNLPASIFADLDAVPDSSMPPLRDFGQGGQAPSRNIPTPTPTPTPVSAVNITPAANDLFIFYAAQASNWGYAPWLSVANDDEGPRPDQYADIDAMEAAGLIRVDRKENGQLDLEDGAIRFTQKGKDYADANGIITDNWDVNALVPPSDNASAAVTTLAPVDERNIFERFVSALTPRTRPPRIEGDPNTRGIVDSNFGTIDIDAVNPSAVQADYANLGWEDQRAAEIAEAARSRPSLETLKGMILRAHAIDRGQIAPADPGERMDLEADIMRMINRVYGLEDITAGEGLRFTNIRPNYEVQTRNGDPSILYIKMDATPVNENGDRLGGLMRYVRIDLRGALPTHAHNSLFTLNQGPAGVPTPAGGSDAYNRWMENWYIANDIPYVDVQAQGGGNWTGAARWALNNFFWQEPSSEIPAKLTLFQRRISAMPDSSAADKRHRSRAQRDLDRLNALVARGIQPSPLQFIMVGWRPGISKNWFGYEAMRSSTWYGKKDLTPDSVSAIEAQQYADMYQVARERMRKRENAFEYNATLAGLLGVEDTYAADNLKELAPFRDEYVPFFSDNADGKRSLAELTPPAREQLYAWVTRTLGEDQYSDKEDQKAVVRLLLQLRDEGAAYDKTPQQAGLNDEFFAKMTTQDIKAAYLSRGFLTIDGAESRYKVVEEIAAGVNPHYRIQNADTGQNLWVKFEGGWHPNSIYEELSSNMLQRMLGLRGASYMATNDSADMVIATAAGSGVRGATPAREARDLDSSEYKNVSLADIADIALLDMINENYDRHQGNWMFIDLGPNVPSLGRYIPLAIDHGGANITRHVQNNDTRVTYSVGGDVGSAFSLASQRNNELKLIMIRETAKRAVERIENSSVYDKNDPTVQIILERLRNASNF